MIYWLQEATEAGAQGAASSLLSALQGAASSLLSALLSPGWAALFGAILASTATHWWHISREHKQRARELVGIARLLDKEMERNHFWLDIANKGAYGQNPRPYEYVPATSVWDKGNLRLAQLLKDDDLFADLVEYYEKAHDLAKYVGVSSDQIQSKMNLISFRSGRLIDLSDTVRPRLQELIWKTQPW